MLLFGSIGYSTVHVYELPSIIRLTHSISFRIGLSPRQRRKIAHFHFNTYYVYLPPICLSFFIATNRAISRLKEANNNNNKKLYRNLCVQWRKFQSDRREK